ncbi:ATP-binding protein [Streptomyces sp. SBC-4]|nr:ATP-binding protein [Streptomyces sp. SBC-4]MDV5143278.1 ATP-binding protein [Streptomyces sp. SBC-4]
MNTLIAPAPPDGRRTSKTLHAMKLGDMPDHITPDPVGPPSYRANYVARDTAPSKARHGVVLALKTWGLERLADTAELLVSELVTNAVTHTDSRTVGVVVTRTDERAVRIMVLDTDRAEMSAPACPSGDEESGRGLFLVAALADRWGVERVATGKRVWCELATKQVVEP